MNFYLDESDLYHKFTELEPEIITVLLDRAGKVIRPISFDEYYELATQFPEMIQAHCYSFGSIILMKKKKAS